MIILSITSNEIDCLAVKEEVSIVFCNSIVCEGDERSDKFYGATAHEFLGDSLYVAY